MTDNRELLVAFVDWLDAHATYCEEHQYVSVECDDIDAFLASRERERCPKCEGRGVPIGRKLMGGPGQMPCTLCGGSGEVKRESLPQYRIPALPLDPAADALVSRYAASRSTAPQTTELPPELASVLRDPNVRLVGEVSALLRARKWIDERLRAAGYDPMACVLENVPPASTASALPSEYRDAGLVHCPRCAEMMPRSGIKAHESVCKPSAPEPRYWRVESCNNHWGPSGHRACLCDAEGRILGRLPEPPMWKNTRAEAEDEGRASGLPEWRKP